MADNKPKGIGETIAGDVGSLGGLFDGLVKSAKRLNKILADESGEEEDEKEKEDGDE